MTTVLVVAAGSVVAVAVPAQAAVFNVRIVETIRPHPPGAAALTNVTLLM
jgi:hypothetical protein